jgi:hypothetical protein
MRYSKPPSMLATCFLGALLSFALGTVVLAWLARGSDDLSLTLCLAVFFYGSGAAAFWVAIPTSIAFDGAGISAYILGIEWRSVRWEQVSEITCRDSTDPFTGMKVKMFQVILPNAKIRFLSVMTDFANLLERLNHYIAEKHIPAFYLSGDSSHLPPFKQLRFPLFRPFYRMAKIPTSRFEI